MFYFILHLSIADLLTAFFTLLPEVVWTLTFPDFHGGVVMCKFVKFTQMLGPYLSSYILIMTAVDRYQAICNPLGNCTWTPKRSKVRFLFHIYYTGQLSKFRVSKTSIHQFIFTNPRIFFNKIW